MIFFGKVVFYKEITKFQICLVGLDKIVKMMVFVKCKLTKMKILSVLSTKMFTFKLNCDMIIHIRGGDFMNIERGLYVDQICKFMDNEQIKIITGIRRCGKSYMLNLIIDMLVASGVKEDHIIKIPMEDMLYDHLRDGKKCHQFVIDKIIDGYKYYILIDEVQLVDGWEQVVNSLRLRNTSVIITGSNSQILSGELATLLSGRYVEFELRTIAFSEYFNSLKMSGSNVGIKDAFDYFVQNGGYPIILATNLEESQVSTIVADIYHSTVLKDVVLKNGIKDEMLMGKLIDYLFDNVGNLISIRKIVDYLNSNGVKTNVQTIGNYIKALERAFVIEKVSRYDIKGKELLASIDKYYVADHSLMYVRKGFSYEYIAQVMENIVYNELKRRGYKVYIGKFGEKEVDFIAEKSNNKVYIQVSYNLSNQETMKRELEPLQKIKDNYNKYIVTMDSLAKGNSEGIEFVYLPDFLLKKEL